MRAALHVEAVLGELSRVGENLRVDGQQQQHPLYYRANQFWRQLEEFKTELDRAARASAYGRGQAAAEPGK